MDLEALYHPADHAPRTWIVGIKTQAKAQVIPEQLWNQDLERCTQIVWSIGEDGRDHVVKPIAVLSRPSDSHQAAQPFGSQLSDEVDLVEPARRVAREETEDQRIRP